MNDFDIHQFDGIDNELGVDVDLDQIFNAIADRKKGNKKPTTPEKPSSDGSYLSPKAKAILLGILALIGVVSPAVVVVFTLVGAFLPQPIMTIVVVAALLAVLAAMIIVIVHLVRKMRK